jgi:signal transduction histidine kinase
MGSPDGALPLDRLAVRSSDELARVCLAVSFVVDEAGIVVGHGAGCLKPVSATVVAPPLGTRVDDTVREADRERFQTAREQAFASGAATVCESYRPAAHVAPVSGDDVLWETHFLSTTEEQGLRHVLVVTRDVSWYSTAVGLAGSLKRDLAHVLRLLTTGSLVTEATHDLMQPLSGIVSFADGALVHTERREAIPAGEVRAWLEALRAQGLEAAGAVRRMREFARRSAQLQEPLSGPAVLADAVQLVTAQARSSGVRIELAPADETISVRGRAVELRQLFVNLLLNGIEARREATAAGVVRIESQGDASHWRVCIADDGCGVPELLRARLFEPFESTKPDGLGLGLAIARKIAEDHGGDIRLSARSTSGAEFEVTLPRFGTEQSDTGEPGTASGSLGR